MLVFRRFIFALLPIFLLPVLLAANLSEAFQCPRGYQSVNGKCQAIQVPPNAELDFTGYGWMCKRGFRIVNGKCVPVVVPENAELDFTGHAWVCKRGYYLSDGKCKPIIVPPNAELDFTGHGWTCRGGFRLFNGKCVPVEVPENAELDFTGHAWVCKRGFYLSERKCKPVIVPQNAELDFTGHGWVCRSGFKKVSNQCVPMTPEELRKQQEQMKKVYEQIQKKRMYIHDRCDTAYRRCVSECKDVSIFDYESGNYISVDNTDFMDGCEDACSRGRRYCEDEDDADEKCYEFKRACRNDCPSNVYDYKSGEYRLLTDAYSHCEDACRAGERECESW